MERPLPLPLLDRIGRWPVKRIRPTDRTYRQGDGYRWRLRLGTLRRELTVDWHSWRPGPDAPSTSSPEPTDDRAGAERRAPAGDLSVPSPEL